MNTVLLEEIRQSLSGKEENELKHIIFVIPTLRMGGAEKALVSLLKALDSARVNVDLFLFEAGGVLQNEVPSYVNIIEADPVTRGMTLEIRRHLKGVIKSGHFAAAFARIGITLGSRFSRLPKFSWNKIKKYIPDLQKNYDVAVGYLEGFTDFFVIDKIKAEKKIGWIHSDFSDRNMTDEEKEYYLCFNELVTISEVCKNAFIKRIPQTAPKFSVVENIVLTDEVRRKADFQIDDRWDKNDVCHLVTVGRLSYEKGIDVAARSAKILSDRNISFCWHIYGKGIMKNEIEQYVNENKINDKFILEGIRENPYPYMKKADIIVQPSRWEGKSIVLDEAKILGKAIVVTSYQSVTDQITDRVTGLITEIEPEKIADGIELLIKDKDLKMKLEENAANEPNRSLRARDMFYDLIDC